MPKKPTQTYDFSQTHIKPNKPEDTLIQTVHKRLLTGNAGDIIPILYKEMLPGDNVKIDFTTLIRQESVLVPVMDNLYADIFTFQMPLKYILDDWKDFFGMNNKQDYWRPPVKKPIPKLIYKAGSGKNKLLNYLGFKESYRKSIDHVNTINQSHRTILNVLYARAYQKIINEYFIDQTVEPPKDFKTDWTDDQMSDYQIARAYKYDDYFQSALNGQQVGDPITIPIDIEGRITGIKDALVKMLVPIAKAEQILDGTGSTGDELYAHNDNGRNKLSTPGGARILQLDKVTELNSDEPQEPIVDIDESKLKITIEDAAGLTIQQIREAATAQQLKELIAQGGERYVEMLSNIWGVKSDDVMQDRPRLIGHDHILLQQSQIANTNFTGANNDTAFLSAFGQTQGITKTAKISVDEHCLIMSVLVIRNEQSYQNGVDQELTREHFEDYYNPMFEGISEQPIKKYEIMATANEEQNQETFGFQEYGARYKTEYNQIFGNFESADDASLEQWHYADNYDTKKEIVLDQGLLKVSQENVNRTIPVNSKTGKDQFLIAVWPKLTWERKMRTYSKPGIRKI